MDDFKRELYMRALTFLENTKVFCVCESFVSSLLELGTSHYGNISEQELPSEELLQSIFTEFFELDDGIKWSNNSDIPEAIPRQRGINSYWWYGTDLVPRIRILNYILNSH